jgi:hypothetical protein
MEVFFSLGFLWSRPSLVVLVMVAGIKLAMLGLEGYLG